ncbi:MAG: electron transport complex subunit RsxC [Bacteroidales bacterium]|nr:electron transport complex subunit RsxC [Bacteroidales bacterium]MBR6992394.1 electron transport complex subunit RsxC [Bacteroidales bacterium]
MKTFKMGGVHPEENKISTNAVIEQMPLPTQVAILMNQHLGAPATPIVAKGDKVKVGQLIAEAQAFMCANIHSSVSGTVNKIDVCKDMTGLPKTAIYIDVEGDEWLESIDRTPDVKRECNLEPKEIVAKLKEMGIVGLGGATFPAHIKYSIPEGKKAEYLIINAAECEPYLTSDHRVMIEHAEEVCVGVSILRKALGVPNAYIGIESNKPEPIRVMTEMARQFEGIIVEPLKVKYPQGAEKQLINAITGRKVPSGKLPIDVGCVVSNVGTSFAVYEAVQKNKPLIENILTVTGKKLPSQHNYQVRIGITYNDIIKQAIGELPATTGKVISGGTMMGKAVSNLSAPTTKGAASVLVMDEAEARRAPETNCIRCGKCANACPMGLEPYLFSALVKNNRVEEAQAHNILDCIECGCCFFSCPANKPLTDEIRLGKFKVRAMMAAKK